MPPHPYSTPLKSGQPIAWNCPHKYGGGIFVFTLDTSQMTREYYWTQAPLLMPSFYGLVLGRARRLGEQQNNGTNMKLKVIFPALLVLGLSCLTASACKVNISVACPPPYGLTAAGIEICVDGVGCVKTDVAGYAAISVPQPGTYTFRVTKSTLPEGAKVSPPTKQLDVIYDLDGLNVVTFDLDWNLCGPTGGPCWMTGGGTIYRANKVPEFTYGGVVYPGCSPLAAEGGNWNVVAHLLGLHFQGQQIFVDSCSGVATRSPKVTVNTIDFHGTGILSGIGGNSDATVPVTFVGRAVDNLEPGGGKDLLFLAVKYNDDVVLQIGTILEPAVIDTGNIQIHTSSCN
jgi:hypothetical protein